MNLPLREWRHINTLSDNSLNTWLAYYRGYSNIGVLLDEPHGFNPMTQTFEPINFTSGDEGMALIEEFKPNMETQWVDEGFSHWWAFLGHKHEPWAEGEGSTHRQAALRCILHSLHQSDSVSSELPPPSAKRTPRRAPPSDLTGDV